MPLNFTKARGSPFMALVLFLAACSAAAPGPAPEPRSLVSTVEAMRTGDLPRLRADQGKGAGLCAHGTALALRLDPEAWLIAMGASGREHDLAAAAAAMRNGDEGALAYALGFSEQQLTADILSGGGSIYSRRSDGRSFYEVGPQPVELLDGFIPPALPQGCLALEATLRGTINERRFKISLGLDPGGVTNLQAGLDMAADAVKAPGRAARYSDPNLALPSTGALHHLDVQCLQDARWIVADLVLLRDDAAIERVQLARDSAGSALVETSVETRDDRLGRQRDERLEFLRLRAAGFERTSGRWPRGLHELSFKPWQLVDPASPAGRLGWADHDAKPPAGLELAESADTEYAVIATYAGDNGRRAVARDGRLLWIR
jgi:hypothetical protein